MLVHYKANLLSLSSLLPAAVYTTGWREIMQYSFLSREQCNMMQRQTLKVARKGFQLLQSLWSKERLQRSILSLQANYEYLKKLSGNILRLVDIIAVSIVTMVHKKNLQISVFANYLKN